jgi:hypothetical protein
MFCRVEIPGRALTDVVQLPRWAVTLEGTVYLVDEGRLRTAPVEISRVEGDVAFVRAGLQPGDVVVTTRLIDPLEGVRLRIREPGTAAGESP